MYDIRREELADVSAPPVRRWSNPPGEALPPGAAGCRKALKPETEPELPSPELQMKIDLQPRKDDTDLFDGHRAIL